MAHDKVYGYCENMCKVEVPAKADACYNVGDTLSYWVKGAAIIAQLGNQLTVYYQVPLERPIDKSVQNISVTLGVTRIYTADGMITITDDDRTTAVVADHSSGNVLEIRFGIRDGLIRAGALAMTDIRTIVTFE
ncbi:hypothetical protein [Priestia megaterium]|uniref:hypothetical protein n=1 Tax=Priestia megaterium TaxID=1404 RepID=UPI002E1EE1D9|nr:hypothetical protein [Priestia megaterium]